MKVTINGISYKVKFVSDKSKKMNPDEENYYLGLVEHVNPTIRIRRNMKGIITRHTVIHEVIHAFIFAYGYHLCGDESVCDFFATQGDEIMRVANEIMKKEGGR